MSECEVFTQMIETEWHYDLLPLLRVLKHERDAPGSMGIVDDNGRLVPEGMEMLMSDGDNHTVWKGDTTGIMPRRENIWILL